MARHAQVSILQPIPYFPIVAPLPEWARKPSRHAKGLKIDHLPMFYIPKYAKSLDGIWLYRSIVARLFSLKKNKGLDVVDAHFGYPEGVGAYRAARKLGVPIVVTLRGFEAEYVHKPIIGRQVRHVIRHADGCICVAHFLKEVAIEHGASPARIRVIHNAIDRDQFKPMSQSDARHKLKLPFDAPLIVSIGHLIFRKRHHVLLSAFAEVLDKHKGARLLVIGGTSFEPNYTRQLKKQAQELGVAGSVEFIGNVDADRIADYLGAADVFALGTQREGCCNAVLEALACGIPVVTTPVGDNSWFVKEGRNGYLVQVDDVGAMANALSQTLARSDWDRFRISGELAVGSWEDVAIEVMSFYDGFRADSVSANRQSKKLAAR